MVTDKMKQVVQKTEQSIELNDIEQNGRCCNEYQVMIVTL